MTGREFLKALDESGTRGAKLDAAKDYLEVNPDAGPMKLWEVMAQAGAGEVTRDKAQELLGVRLGLAEQQQVPRPPFPVRAPEGGAKVGETDYPAGAVVPEAALVTATAEELKLLVEGEGGKDAPKDVPADTHPVGMPKEVGKKDDAEGKEKPEKKEPPGRGPVGAAAKQPPPRHDK